MKPTLQCAIGIGVILLLVGKASAQLTMQTSSFAQIDAGGPTDTQVDGGFVNFAGRRSSAGTMLSVGGNFVEANTDASVFRALRIPGPLSFAPLGEIPATVIASGNFSIDGMTYRANYANSPNMFNAQQFMSGNGGSEASALYELTNTLSASAPVAAQQTSIPYDLFVNWSVFESGTGGQGNVTLEIMDSGQTVHRFSARLDATGLDVDYFGADPAAGAAFGTSGGRFPLSQFNPGMAQPIRLGMMPGASYSFFLYANAGAAGTGKLENNWLASGIGTAFIDPILRVDPTYPYVDYLSVEVSEGTYIDVAQLYNPLAGTAAEAIGDGLLNASYNMAPIPEPSQWLMLAAGVGLLGSTLRRSAVATRRA